MQIAYLGIVFMVIIGLLASAASMILYSEIVKEATDGYLEPREQAFLASWFRHIPESALPTYTAVLLMLNLSGVEIARFLAGMIVPVLTLVFLGYVTYLRRISKDTGTPGRRPAVRGQGMPCICSSTCGRCC